MRTIRLFTVVAIAALLAVAPSWAADGKKDKDKDKETLQIAHIKLSGDLDEAPQAYRRLPDVLAHHAGTVEIEHTLKPFAVVMAGADVFDPFKD